MFNIRSFEILILYVKNATMLHIFEIFIYLPVGAVKSEQEA
jgi:predicted Co/Zn/Cd cation transporter (cation efflux family)